MSVCLVKYDYCTSRPTAFHSPWAVSSSPSLASTLVLASGSSLCLCLGVASSSFESALRFIMAINRGAKGVAAAVIAVVAVVSLLPCSLCSGSFQVGSVVS